MKNEQQEILEHYGILSKQQKTLKLYGFSGLDLDNELDFNDGVLKLKSQKIYSKTEKVKMESLEQRVKDLQNQLKEAKKNEDTYLADFIVEVIASTLQERIHLSEREQTLPVVEEKDIGFAYALLYSVKYIKENSKEEFLEMPSNETIEKEDGNTYLLGTALRYRVKKGFTPEQKAIFNEYMEEYEIDLTADEVVQNMFTGKKSTGNTKKRRKSTDNTKKMSKKQKQAQDDLFEELLENSKQYIIAKGKEEFLKMQRYETIKKENGDTYPLGASLHYVIKKGFTPEYKAIFNDYMEAYEIDLTVDEVNDKMFTNHTRADMFEKLLENSKLYILENGKEEFLKMKSTETIKDANGKDYPLGLKLYTRIVNKNFMKRQARFDEYMKESEIDLTAEEVNEKMFKSEKTKKAEAQFGA